MKEKEIKGSFMKPSKKKILKSKIKEINDSLYDSIINSDEKIEKIKIIFYGPRNDLLKQEEDPYKPVGTGNAFSKNYIEYKSNGDKDKALSIKDYLGEITPYLSDIINDHHSTQGEWKIYLTMAINLFSSKDSEDTHTMYSESDNIEVMIVNETNKIIEDLFDSLLQRHQHQKNSKESMIESEFVFDSH